MVDMIETIDGMVTGYRDACTDIRKILHEYFDDIRREATGNPLPLPAWNRREECLAYIQQRLPDVADGTIIPPEGGDGSRLVLDARTVLQQFDEQLSEWEQGRGLDAGVVIEQSERIARVAARLADHVEGLAP